MNVILSSGTLLVETVEGLEPRAREQLVMIQRSVGQMDCLIQDLLEVAGMEAGNISSPGRSGPDRS